MLRKYCEVIHAPWTKAKRLYGPRMIEGRSAREKTGPIHMTQLLYRKRTKDLPNPLV